MTKIIITYKHNDISNIEISGHANSGDYGKDIVCAGISAVTFGALNAIKGIKKKDVTLNEKDGYINIKISKQLSDEDKIKLNMMIVQLDLIAKSNKKNVAIKKEKN